MSLLLQLEELPDAERVRSLCEERATQLRAEFPETTRVEVKVQRAGPEHETHIHVTGRELEVASRARGTDPLGSVHDAFEKARRQLRKHHDKRIYARRRDAHRGS
jgi:ribosome-associated translation inhibitor RaiA